MDKSKDQFLSLELSTTISSLETLPKPDQADAAPTVSAINTVRPQVEISDKRDSLADK